MLQWRVESSQWIIDNGELKGKKATDSKRGGADSGNPLSVGLQEESRKHLSGVNEYNKQKERDERFAAVFGELRDSYEDELSEQAIEQMNEYESTFRMLLNSKFYRSVGKYEGHLQESAVLQQRSGYRNIYKYWQMLKCGLSLEQGRNGKSPSRIILVVGSPIPCLLQCSPLPLSCHHQQLSATAIRLHHG